MSDSARELRAAFDDRTAWAEALYVDTLDIEDRWADPDHADGIEWADEGEYRG